MLPPFSGPILKFKIFKTYFFVQHGSFGQKKASERKDSIIFLVMYHSKCAKSALESIYTAPKFHQHLVATTTCI